MKSKQCTEPQKEPMGVKGQEARVYTANQVLRQATASVFPGLGT